MNNLINLKDINYIPEYQLDLGGWNGNSNVFKQLIEFKKPQIIVEVGTWKGQSALNMANIIKNLNLQTKIYCIDTWLGAEEFWTWMKDTSDRNLLLKNGYPQIYYQFLSNVFHTKNQDIITPIPNTSHIGSIILKHYNINPDLIYIDASHNYNDVLSDLNDYYELLNNNGIIFGDDFGDGWPGVKNAVNDFCINNNLGYEIFENNFWIIKK
jgi:hypothetical protein